MRNRQRWLVSLWSFALAATFAATAASASTWTQIASGAPPARSGAASAYDPVSGKVVLFGGYQVTPAGTVVYLNDTWTFDGKVWTRMSGNAKSTPSVRTAAAMAYDAVTKQVVMFGGYNGSLRLGDTWTWDGAHSKWTSQSPRRAPPPATGPMGFQDPGTGHAIMIGGFDGQFYHNATWRWTGRTWELVTTATTPYARAFAICALNPVLKQVVVFGGLADVNPNNTWTWNGVDWTMQSPANQPPLRFDSGAAYDPGAAGVVFFGAGMSDTWVWDGSNWTPLAPTASPSPRSLYAMTNDDALGHPILYGGEDPTGTTQFDDTWEFTTAP